ncbi:hypothetical protein [Candidatus Cytomitobacter primus]|uniref:Uncharacterized protein n=1 Tax=Candidatus Cytomitobacter primus TaxID=2066024 RepID=A0A5C0UGI2_9PROT|nr:hypothetical protein [Candidatus Cytomitobacter primus]QEK38402.1 hypothetical protein FZC34_00505 [Candidatus Cytomitobacter primus]
MLLSIILCCFVQQITTNLENIAHSKVADEYSSFILYSGLIYLKHDLQKKKIDYANYPISVKCIYDSYSNLLNIYQTYNLGIQKQYNLDAIYSDLHTAQPTLSCINQNEVLLRLFSTLYESDKSMHKMHITWHDMNWNYIDIYNAMSTIGFKQLYFPTI